MQAIFLEGEHPYTGSELSSQFGHMTAGILGDSVVAWIGPCDVKTEQLVDGEDVINNDCIYSESMLHIIAEVFHRDIFYGIWLQRFITMTVKELILKETKKDLERRGDDLYFEDQKLNVSIATVSGVSTLVHFGINVISDNTPVKAIGLKDLEIEPKAFASELIQAVESEVLEIDRASKKVFTV